MTRALKPLFEGGRYFEAPRWRDGRWWVSDFYRHAVFTVTPHGRSEKVLDVEQQPSGLGWLPDGSLLVVSMKNASCCGARRRATSACMPSCPRCAAALATTWWWMHTAPPGSAVSAST